MTGEWRMRAYPRVFLAAVGVAFLVVVMSGSGSSTVSGRVGGDFPAFYTAGAIVADGDIDDLYDPAAQSIGQDTLLGSESGYLAFAYAPHVALVYSPLSLAEYRLAYVIHTAVMVAALFMALRLMRPMVGLIDRWFALTVAASIGFYPVFMALGGGQNTAITLLLISWMWRSLVDDREAAAGIAVALMMFRPQYALPLMALLFVGRHLRAVRWAVSGAAATWLVDAVMMGPMWVTEWLASVGPFVSNDAEVNAHNSVAVIGFLQALLGADSRLALLVGSGASLVVAATLGATWWRRSIDTDLLVALAATGIVLMSPHTMFYDAGLIVVTIAVLVNRQPDRWPLVPLVILAAMTQLAAPSLGFSPFAPVVATVFVIAVRETRQGSVGTSARKMAVT